MRDRLFGDLYAPRAAFRRRWWLAAMSLIAHVTVVATVLIIPLLAIGALPQLRGMETYVIPVEPAAPPDLPRQRVSRHRSSHSAIESPGGFPVIVPTVIGPEPGIEPATHDSPGYGGLPGLGTIDLPMAEPEPPPAQPPARRPIRMHSGMTPPSKVLHVPPEYPPVARQARIEGVVIIEAVIGADGRVVEARVLRSVALLDEAALAAVRQWIFKPARLNGEPVAVVITVTVNFTMRN